MNNILVLEFITSVGGVQTVYKSILPYLANEHKIFFLDPYKNNFDDELLGTNNIEVVNLPICSKSALGWSESLKKNCMILIRYGCVYVQYLYKLVRYIKNNNIDLIYVSGKKEIIYAYILKRMIKTNYIYHSHGFNSYRDISILYKTCMNSAEKIISVSQVVKATLIQAGISKEKIQVVYNGLDIELARARSRYLKSHDDKIIPFKIVIIGAIQPTKGVHTIIKAINILLKKGMDVSLEIIGEVTSTYYDIYKEKLIVLSREVNHEKFSFLGFQKNVYEHINEANILVLPSTTESFGMVLLEAMYLSKAVLGSNVGGIPEVIDNGTNGILFESENEEELAEKIELLYMDRELCKKMGHNGYERLLDLFTSLNQSQQILKIINDI